MNDIGKIVEDVIEKKDGKIQELESNSQLIQQERDTLKNNLKWLVWFTITEGVISVSRGAELLGLTILEMREWLRNYGKQHNTI